MLLWKHDITHCLLFEEADGFHFEMHALPTHSYLLMAAPDERNYIKSLPFNLLQPINVDEVIDGFVSFSGGDLLKRLFNPM